MSFQHKADSSNEKDHWLTPPLLLEALGGFDLDPCAYHAQPWQSAKRHYALPHEDGLLLPWEGRVWCNPPYGKETGKWMERMALHDNGIMLVFARLETENFRPTWRFGHSVLALYTRIAFFRPDGTESDSGTAPSVLIAFGATNTEALRRLKQTKWNGALITNWEA